MGYNLTSLEKCAGAMVAQNLWKWPMFGSTWDTCSILPGWPGSHPEDWIVQTPMGEPNMAGLKRKKKTMAWFLMILWYIHRLPSSSVVTRKTSSRSRWKQVQRSIARHYAEEESKLKVPTGSLLSELREAGRRRGGKILRVRGDRGHQNMAHWINKANLIRPHRAWRDKHSACKGLHKVLYVYLSTVSFVFL